MQSSNQKIIIYGGTFDPVHFGHTELVKKAIEIVNPDKVIVVPTYETPLKNRVLSPAIDRYNMLKLAFKNWKLVEISDYEINKKTKSYTIDTMEYFKSIYPNAELYFLLGSDQLANIKQWKRYDELLDMVTIICYKRAHYCQCCKNHPCYCDTPIKGIKNIIYIKDRPLDISSTKIRKIVHGFELNEEVLKYINNHGLYAAERVQKFTKESRYAHCLRVGYMCRDLMEHWNPELKDIAYSAGIYHDIAKDMDLNEQVAISENILGITEYVSPRVLHGHVGAYQIKMNYKMENELILDSIRRHTRPFDYYETEPTLLDKVVYLCDKLEPNRTDEDVCGDIEYFRKLAYQDIDRCFTELYEHTQKAFAKK